MKVSQGNGQIRNSKNTQRSVETGWRSTSLQARYKGSTFISQTILRPWVFVWPLESNPRRPCLQSIALLTELVRPCPAPRKPTTGLELKVAGRCSCSQKCPWRRTGGETWNYQIWWDYLKILNRSKLLLDLLLWRTKLLLSACSSKVILCARVYVLFVSNYFQFTTPKNNNNNNNKIKDTFLIPGKLTQTSYQNTRATDRRLKYLD